MERLEILSSHCPMAYMHKRGGCPFFKDAILNSNFVSISSCGKDDGELLAEIQQFNQLSLPIWLYLDREVELELLYVLAYSGENIVQIHINPQTYNNDKYWIPSTAYTLTQCGITVVFYISNIFPGVLNLSFVLNIFERLKGIGKHEFMLDFGEIPVTGNDKGLQEFIDSGDLEVVNRTIKTTAEYKKKFTEILQLYGKARVTCWNLCSCFRR